MVNEGQGVPPTDIGDKAALPPAVDDKRFMAKLAMEPFLGNAYVTSVFAKGVVGETDVAQCLRVLLENIDKVKKGNLGGAEANLVAQATALNAIFNDMAGRAAASMDQHLNVSERLLRLAFKAQAQCRATLQTLADIKNPQSVSFVRQANIAHGPQQINNGQHADTAHHAREKNPIQSNELSGERNELLPDTRASQAQIRINPKLETMGAIHRPPDCGGEGHQRRQQQKAWDEVKGGAGDIA
jgi:hypothetical protein